MKCVNCGIRLPDGMESCSSCGAKQSKLPVVYCIFSWALLVIVMAFGAVRIAMGVRNLDWANIYRGALACCGAVLFIPQIKPLKNYAVVILAKVAIVALLIAIM